MSNQHPPDRRKHGYQELYDKLEAHTKEIEERLRAFFVKALAAFAIIGLISAGALFGFGVVLREIQSQRYDSLILNCEQTNERHDEVIRQLDKAVAQSPNPEKAEAARKPFQLILEAGTPYIEDCSQYARSRVKGVR